MVICNICNEESSLPYKLQCGHIYCFMCIKELIYTGFHVCPQCNMFISDDISKIKIDDLYKYSFEQRKVFWLYSSNYNNHWWCYDSDSNIKLENIYNDYKSRTMQDENNNSIDVVLDTSVISNSKNDLTIEDIILDHEILKLDPKNIRISQDENSNNLIDFTVDSDDNNSPTEESEPISNYLPLSYLIKICGINYKIDFDQMKQINLNNSSKKRFIKRVEINGKIENQNIDEYLKNNYNVLGVAGVNF